MMERRAYRITPNSGLHLGREGLEQETASEVFPSDSLFSALVALQAQRNPVQLSALLAGLPMGDDSQVAPLRLSSCFPVVGQVAFFPRPRLKVKFPDDDGMDKKPENRIDGKVLKKIQYVSAGVLERLLAEKDMAEFLRPHKKGCFIQGRHFWLMPEEQKQLPKAWQSLPVAQLAEQEVYKHEAVTRVSIDRLTHFSSVYQVARTTFAEHCGLWVMVEADTDRQTLVHSLLDDLQETGIGAERSSGYGSFKLTDLPLSEAMTKPTEGRGRGLLLSRYNPTSAELQAQVLGEKASYEVIDVGGWVYSAGQPGQRRQRVRMLEAGSVLDMRQLERVNGRIVDVRRTYPTAQFPHPVYRSGIALTL